MEREEQAVVDYVQNGTEGEDVTDWLGRPAIDRKLGGWMPAILVSVSTCCLYFAYGGVFFNLVLYLMRVRGQSPANAANDVTNLVGTTFFTSLLGALVGDAYLGRLWTVVLFVAVYLVGSVMLGLAVSKPEFSSAGLLYGSLYVIAVGSGSYEPVVASLGGDQIHDPTKKTIFFSMLFMFCSLGQLLALTALTYVENKGQWALGFWISGGAVLVSLPIFFVGASSCRQFKPGGNPLLRVVQVVVAAGRRSFARKQLHWPTRSAGASLDEDVHQRLYETEAWKPSVIPGCGKLRHTEQFRWLDKAAILENDRSTRNTWRVCSVTQVEEVKCLLRILPFVLVGVMYNVVLAQVSTFFLEQAATMDGRLGPHFSIPPGSMALFLFGAASVFAPLYDHLLAPLCHKVLFSRARKKELTLLQRMGIGLVVTIVAMLVAAQVERQRLHAAAVNSLLNDPTATIPISMYWLVPQYVILGISLVFTIIAQMHFFYAELSDGMKSIGMCLTLLCRGIGNYVSTLLVTIVTHTTARGRPGWIPRNLNQGHLHYFYWLLAILMAITLVFHVVAAHFHVYRQTDEANVDVKVNDSNAEVEMNVGRGFTTYENTATV